MNKISKRKRKASKSGAQALEPSAKIQKKDKVLWCTDCWVRPTAACKGHRLVDAAAARTEVVSTLSKMCSKMEYMQAKIENHSERLKAVDDLLEEGRIVLSIEAEVGESYGLSIKGGVFKLVLAVDSHRGRSDIHVFCRALDGVDFVHSDKVGDCRPATFNAGMPTSLFNRLPYQPDALAVREGTVLVSAIGTSGDYEFRIYTKSVKPLLKYSTKVLGRVTENLNAVAMDVGDCCANTNEMGGGFLRNVHVLF